VSDSIILRTAVRLLVPVLLLVSLMILLRGHNEPGGGFIGGLLAAGAVALLQLAEGCAAARRLLRVDPRTVLGAGLVASVATALAGFAAGGSLLEGLWWKTPVPGIGKLSTVLLFDIGVYLVVVGTVLLIVLELAQDREGAC
jgi:multicomponent Na+:H+ antiporter subunit B